MRGGGVGVDYAVEGKQDQDLPGQCGDVEEQVWQERAVRGEGCPAEARG